MFESPLQQGVFNALSAAFPGAVYDDVPEGAAFPYITVGESTTAPLDTEDANGADATVTVHVWSRHRGRSECKSMQDEIYAALHLQPITVEGFHLIGCVFEDGETFMDADGLTRHGVQRFRILIHE